jgi:hypothetical protein
MYAPRQAGAGKAKIEGTRPISSDLVMALKVAPGLCPQANRVSRFRTHAGLPLSFLPIQVAESTPLESAFLAAVAVRQLLMSVHKHTVI